VGDDHRLPFRFEIRWGQFRRESFPIQMFEFADVSPIEGTIGDCKYRFFFSSPRNRTQEADGSIPFISTISLAFLDANSLKNE